MSPSDALKAAPRDWAALAALVAMWGSAFSLTTIAVAGMAPVWVASVRITLGAALLWLVMRTLGEVLPRDRTIWAWFAWLGFIGNVAPFVLISWAQQSSPAALGDVSLDGMRILAELAVLLAAAGYALNAVTARLAPPVAGLVLGTGVLVAAAPQALLIALLSAPLPGVPSIATLTAVVLLGVFPTALAAALLYPLLMRAGAGFVATSNYYVPCFAVLLGVAFMGESLNAFDYAGFAVILLGVIVAQSEGWAPGQ